MLHGYIPYTVHNVPYTVHNVSFLLEPCSHIYIYIYIDLKINLRPTANGKLHIAFESNYGCLPFTWKLR